MTHRILLAALLVAGAVGSWLLLGPLLRASMTRPSPTQPEEPDEREASGADEVYGDDLEQLRHSEKELASLAAELDLNILDEEQRAWAVDALDLRLMVAEDIDHFSQRLGGILDDFAPGWFEEAPTTALPTFRAVHALVDETGEFAVVGA